MPERQRLIEKLEMLSQRADWCDPSRMPSGNCKDITTHLAGIFLKTHYRMILEALKRMD